jgi:hypothetical protein
MTAFEIQGGCQVTFEDFSVDLLTDAVLERQSVASSA